MKTVKATINMADSVYELVRATISEVYKKYYPDEAVRYFLGLHSVA